MINIRFLLFFVVVSFQLHPMSNNSVPTLKELSLKRIDKGIELEFEKQMEENEGDFDKSLANVLAKIPTVLHEDIKKAYQKAKGYYVDPPFYRSIDFRCCAFVPRGYIERGSIRYQFISSTFEQMMLKYALQRAVAKKDGQLQNKIFDSSIFVNLEELNKRQLRHYALEH